MRKLYFLLLVITSLSFVTEAQVNLVGFLYGKTDTSNASGIVRVNTGNNSVKVLQALKYVSSSPRGYNLLVQPDGTMYGVSDYDINASIGARVFKVAPDGSYSPLHIFPNNADYANPTIGVKEGPDGRLYGTATGYPYADDRGLLYALTTTGGYTELHQFNTAAGGFNPNSLVFGTGGIIYGTTEKGGANDGGVVFSLTPDGIYTVLHDFATADGITPSENTLFLGQDGKLYGATEGGGSNGNGTIYSITTAGVFSVVHSLNNATDGSIVNGLMQAANGKILGVTDQGAANGYGGIFSIQPSDGTITLLHSFSNDPSNGYFPEGGLVEDGDGIFYGTASSGGVTGAGLLYSITGSGTFTILRPFADQSTTQQNFPEGAYPVGTPVFGPNGRIFSITKGGGLGDSEGTIFSIDKLGNNYKTLFNYATISPLGSNLSFAPTVGPDKTVYGVTTIGGKYNEGNIFSVSPAGEYKVLHDFQIAVDGGWPSGSLVLGPDGSLYGAMKAGGALSINKGTIYRLTPEGNFEVLHTFLENESAEYWGKSLVLGNDGILYGISKTFSGLGVQTDLFFSLIPQSRTFTIIANLPESVDFQRPIIQASDGLFYGSTGGSIYSLTKTGQLTILATVSAYSQNALLEAKDGRFYYAEGSSIFAVTKAGAVTEYSSTIGEVSGPLMEASDGLIYGGNNPSAASTSVFSFNPANGQFTALANITGATGYYNLSGLVEADPCVSPTITTPANITTQAATAACSAAVDYTATVNGFNTTVSYLFSGATTGSGTGDGSGQTFNSGVTTVQVIAKNNCGADTTTFTITVTDTQSPVASATATVAVCANATGTYVIPQLTANDNCGVTSITYVVTGATSRSGSGTNASGVFNSGTSTITWTVKDAANNTAIAISTVKVNAAPTASIAANSAAFCSTTTLTASGNTAGPYTYEWYRGTTQVSTSGSLVLNLGSASGAYSVVVTDASGCKSTNNPVYNYDGQSQYTAYSVIALNSLEFGKYNRVTKGSVGVTKSGATAKFGDYDSIPAGGSSSAFVKASVIKVGKSVYIPNRVTSPATVVLPPVLQNNLSGSGKDFTVITSNWNQGTVKYRNITINSGNAATLTDSVYGTILVTSGSTVTFTKASVYIGQLIVIDGTGKGSKPYSQVKFIGKTNVRVSGYVLIGGYVKINPDAYDVTFYLASSSSSSKSFTLLGGGTTVNANIYIPVGTMAATAYSSGNRSNINGMVIAQTILSGDYINWNGSNCSSAANTRGGGGVEGVAEAPAELIVKAAFDVKVYSNPTPGDFQLFISTDDVRTPIQVKLHDIPGRLLGKVNGAQPNSTTRLSSAGLINGTYIAEVTQGNNKKIVKMILLH